MLSRLLQLKSLNQFSTIGLG